MTFVTLYCIYINEIFSLIDFMEICQYWYLQLAVIQALAMWMVYVLSLTKKIISARVELKLVEGANMVGRYSYIP